MSRVIVCKGCGTRETLVKAPPGAIPDQWVLHAGSAYCGNCQHDVPTLHLSQRMSESATASVLEACSVDSGLRANIQAILESETPGSPEFVRRVRSAVEASCALGAESLPAPMRSLFNDVLACVQWLRVAERLAARGPSSASNLANPKPLKGNGDDPFSL